jgi:hypothetical protein
LANIATIIKDAYVKAESRQLFFKMLIPIITFQVTANVLFYSTAAQNCLTSVVFLCSFAYSIITLKIIVCSITRVT